MTQQNTTQNDPTLADWFRSKWARVAGRQNSNRPATQTSWGRLIAFVAVVVSWAFGAYYGFIALPDLAALGGILGVIGLVLLILGPFLLVLSDSKTWRTIGVVVAIIGGIILGSTGGSVLELLAGFTALSTLGTVIAIAVTAVVAIWLSRVPKRQPTTTVPAPQASPSSQSSAS